MNAQLLGGIGVPIILGALYLRDRHLKSKVRGCRGCGRTHVVRTFKMYPIIGDSKEGVVAEQPIVIENGRAPFTVYKFSECLHCGNFAMVESYDKRFTIASLRHKVHKEPLVFRHDPTLFKRGSLTPCKTLNLNFDPQILGDATLEERHFGFRLPWRIDKQIVVTCT